MQPGRDSADNHVAQTTRLPQPQPQPPYSKRSPAELGPARWRGRCQCGQVLPLSGLTFYSSSCDTTGHKWPTKVYCKVCQTPIMDEGRNSVERDEGRKKRREAFEVDCHIFYGQRVVDVPDGKPKWAGLDGQSDLLDEGGGKRKTD
ncbi:hypothetical protein BO71DRAFT_422514 [Aspergillus ellipticus CBS 707.79]|uniref:CENP-V/GFA domain-containing protein n=1 Tax=Aspergillus ellipticus CBS 707.79 TaxID=1448320 RepID=A0A319CYI0_9EURO|nr:hypothetical protein BO71DRAFT_422514 [Aspergillus ellipticus CBS 707.79]